MDATNGQRLIQHELVKPGHFRKAMEFASVVQLPVGVANGWVAEAWRPTEPHNRGLDADMTTPIVLRTEESQHLSWSPSPFTAYMRK
jgi:hypothetical protein